MSAFTSEQLDALFDAILVNDVVDAAVDLPDTIRLDYPADHLRDGFAISRSLWEAGFDRDALLVLVARLGRYGTIDAEEQVRFKHIRAKFKHQRFAFVLYGADHRCPPAFKAVTTVMGHLQDAFRNGRRAAVSRHALLLRALLAPVPLALLRREIAGIRFSDPDDFRTFTIAQIRALRIMIAAPLTGHQFHVARKIVSRQVSFHDDMRIAHPAPDHLRLSRYLSAINGLMGRHHDTLVMAKTAGTLDYARHAFALPQDIHERLSALVARYP